MRRSRICEGEGRELADAGEVAARDLDLEWSGWQQELNTDSQGGAAAGQRGGAYSRRTERRRELHALKAQLALEQCRTSEATALAAAEKERADVAWLGEVGASRRQRLNGGRALEELMVRNAELEARLEKDRAYKDKTMERASGYASRSRVIVCMMCACLYVNVCSDVLGVLSP